MQLNGSSSTICGSGVRRARPIYPTGGSRSSDPRHGVSRQTDIINKAKLTALLSSCDMCHH
jgi:hypothetical protein